MSSKMAKIQSIIIHIKNNHLKQTNEKLEKWILNCISGYPKCTIVPNSWALQLVAITPDSENTHSDGHTNVLQFFYECIHTQAM